VDPFDCKKKPAVPADCGGRAIILIEPPNTTDVPLIVTDEFVKALLGIFVSPAPDPINCPDEDTFPTIDNVPVGAEIEETDKAEDTFRVLTPKVPSIFSLLTLSGSR
jgi:hypothetical protein